VVYYTDINTDTTERLQGHQEKEEEASVVYYAEDKTDSEDGLELWPDF
jgi:hypothetical protein